MFWKAAWRAGWVALNHAAMVCVPRTLVSVVLSVSQVVASTVVLASRLCSAPRRPPGPWRPERWPAQPPQCGRVALAAGSVMLCAAAVALMKAPVTLFSVARVALATTGSCLRRRERPSTWVQLSWATVRLAWGGVEEWAARVRRSARGCRDSAADGRQRRRWLPVRPCHPLFQAAEYRVD